MDISQKILSDIIIFNKYARYIPELSRRETWEELCERNMAMHIRKYPQLKDEIRKVYKDFVLPKKILPSMRSLQFGGGPIELSANRMFNCAAVAMDHPDAFSETIFLLLGGSGIGMSVQKHHVEKLPIVIGPKPKTRRFLIGDSIEGWSDAIKILVEAYFHGKSDPIFDYRDIRPKGARLVTSGGKAPGPAPLKICIEQIRAILNNAVGRKLQPLEVHDIQCHLADAVLSGGIRRAAMISLFSKDDMDMLCCKSGAWWELNPQRGRANNSVVLLRSDTTDEEFFDIWERVEESGAGEPGIFWTNDLELLSNPCCVTGDTIIDIEIDGSKQRVRIKDVVELYKEKEIKVLSFNGLNSYERIMAAKMTRRDAELVRITDTDTGKQLICTPDHRIFTENRGYVRADELISEDILKIN